MENAKNAKTSKLNTYLLAFIAVTSVLLVCVTSVVLIFVLKSGENDNEDNTPTAVAQPTQTSDIQILTSDGVLKRIESTNVLQTTVFR